MLIAALKGEKNKVCSPFRCAPHFKAGGAFRAACGAAWKPFELTPAFSLTDRDGEGKRRVTAPGKSAAETTRWEEEVVVWWSRDEYLHLEAH